MKTLSKKQINQYLKNPRYCPVCGGDSISAGAWDGETQCQEIYCEDCRAEWREIFSMVSVELRDR